MNVASLSIGRDGRVLGLVGLGHGLSHFYQLIFAPLIIVWHADLGVSYAVLGAVLTTFTLAGGVAQMPAGVAVDRWGARPILVGGLVLSGLAFAAMGSVTSVWQLFVLAALAGVGNAVFHPADYAILNSSINPARMGKAFSLHTFAGHLGGALAPATMAILIGWGAGLGGWRFAMWVVGAFGIVCAIILMLQGGILRDEHHEATDDTRKKAKNAFSWKENVELLLSPAMMALFMFFLVASLASGGIAAFSQVVNVQLHGITLEAAGTALSAFLFASTGGILLGGVAADKTSRHDAQAAIAFFTCAVIFALVAVFPMHEVVLIALFAVAGLAHGMIRPARDMMVRALAPKGTAGRAFAWASTGMSIGSAVAPIMFGIMIDMGAMSGYYWVIAAFNLLAILTVTSTRWVRRAPAEQPAE